MHGDFFSVAVFSVKVLLCRQLYSKLDFDQAHNFSHHN